ncbi:MAG: hypothetical protein AB8I08_25740 [Sandaracinaceae bacterium]
MRHKRTTSHAAGWAAAALALVACSPTLSEPERFEDVCDFDVREDLLIGRCSTVGCHVPFQPQAGVDFISGGLAERLVDVDSTTCAGQPLIDSANPEASFLLVRVNETPTCEGEEIDRMPLGRPHLTDRELACLAEWVSELAAEGAPDAGWPAGGTDAGAPPVDAGGQDAGSQDAGE